MSRAESRPAPLADPGPEEDDARDAEDLEDPDGVGRAWEPAEDGSTRPPTLALLVAGVAGLLASLVLTVDRFRLLADPQAELGCDVSPFIACGPVMQSRAGALLGFPNPLLGLVGFTLVLTTGVLVAGRVRLPRWYWRGLQAGVLLAAGLLTFLQTQSLYVIGALCLWCLLVWAVTLPLVVAVTLHNAAAGHLGAALQRPGRRLAPYTVTVAAVWLLLVAGAIALRFGRDFALMWFGVAL